MRSLSGHVVLVTGGNGGIGLGMAKAVARAGADVVIWGRDRRRNELAAEEVRSVSGRRCWAFECDVSDDAQVVEVFERSVNTAGRLDAAFANAGISGKPSAFTALTLEGWRHVLETNLDGTFLVLREAARFLQEQGMGGALVATASLSAFKGGAGMHPYAVSKAGLVALIRGLAVELAPHGIRCNALAPGWFDTELTAPVKASPTRQEALVRRMPVRRWGTPDDLDATAVYLADKSVTMHTGDVLVVDGAYLLT